MMKFSKTGLFLIASACTTLVMGQTPKKPTQENKAGKPKAEPAVETKKENKPNPWIFTYGADTVKRAEFERLLSKNRKDKSIPTDQEIREYLELYENFKLKVKEALAMQLDTMPSFKTELAGYRKQLANPYLTDKKVTEGLIQEAYQRMLEEIKASHILINCSENASPKDTLEAYNRIMELRKRIMKGESFDSVAYSSSEDPSAKRNYGNLGWFTSFYMIYSFESQAYRVAKGQVSMPFRTRFGYHLVKVTDRRPARGEAKVGHIMIQTGASASAETVAAAKLRIDSAYNKLLSGAPFEEVVKTYSMDQNSIQNGGIINSVGSLSNFPDAFKDVVFSTTIGATAKPFQTDYGWHIIKVIDRKEVPELKEVEDMIKNKITKDSRSESSKLVVAQRIKRENKYRENPENIKSLIAAIDTTFLSGTWIPNESKFSNKPVFSIADKNYSQLDFVGFLRVMQEPQKGGSIQTVVTGLLKKFADEKALEYEESILETKYEDFKNLMQEYHDGILLFDLMDKKVWNKALVDTTGMEKFHALTPNKYMWKERISVSTVTCLDEKAKKEAMKMAAAGKSLDEIKAKLNKKIQGTIAYVTTKHEKGANADFDNLWDKKGVVDIPGDGNILKFYVVNGVVGPEPKTTREAKGAITIEYQTYLETEWIKELRAKYPITVNEPALKTLFR